MLSSATGTQTGVEAYLATCRFMIGLFVDHMEPVSIAVEGDVATVSIIDRLTARANIVDFMGQPVGKGQTFTLDLVGRCRIVHGRITRIEIAPAG
ncbi:hypothetical protein FHS96_000368 [Sphingomonas zeicaulis]|uniref:nuclear transport factor 2 family protein n=1 Tax=Sphingomonas zeicaulis TaxID=1632740 RepID=UPI003D25E645